MTNTFIEIFRGILQLSDVQAEDDFFALGGDSAMAVALVLEIERQTGVNLPSTALFDAPTPAALAQLIASQKPETSPVILLKPGTGAPPIFVLPGISGLIMELMVFARLIDADHPVYAIQAKGVDGRDAPLSSIEDMADYCLPLIRAIQPRGPYLLAGYSMGGLVALELARRLQSSGGEIALLAMLDTYFQPAKFSCGQWLRIWKARLRHHARQLATMRANQVIAYAARRTGGWLADLNSIAGSRRRQAQPIDPALPEPIRRMIGAGRLAVSRYQPMPYRGTINFLQADPEFHVPASPEIVWGDLAERFILCPVSGDHRTIISVHAGQLAHWLSLMARNATCAEPSPHPVLTAVPCPA